MLLIVLLVLFTLVMGIWALALVGAIAALAGAASWFPFCACLILGIMMFLVRTGAIEVPPPR